MEIVYFGHASFRIKTKTGIVVLDPFSPETLGQPFPKIEADVVTISHQHGDHNAAHLVSGRAVGTQIQAPLVINLPGEYEKNGIRIAGYETFHDKNKGAERGKNTMFKIEAEDIAVLHCGDLGHVLSAEAVEMIDGIDVLMVPVGGFYTIDADEARQIVEKLEPSIVIPMHFRNDVFAPAIMDKLAPLDDFLAKLGVTTSEPVAKLTVSQADFGEETKVVVLSQQS